MRFCEKILSSILGACVILVQTSNISVSAVQVTDLVFSKEPYFKQDFDLAKCKQMISKHKNDEKLFERAEGLGCKLFYWEQQNFSDTLIKLFDSNEELTSSKIGEHAHHSPVLVRCALCLMGLNNYGSNFNDCLLKYKELVSLMEEVYNLRNGRKAAVISAFVFCQRMGFSDIVDGDINVKTDTGQNKLELRIVSSGKEILLSITLAVSIVANIVLGVSLYVGHDSKFCIDEHANKKGSNKLCYSIKSKRQNNRRFINRIN